MDLEGITLIEISQSDEDKYHRFFSLVWNLRNRTNEQRKKKQTKK